METCKNNTEGLLYNTGGIVGGYEIGQNIVNINPIFFFLYKAAILFFY